MQSSTETVTTTQRRQTRIKTRRRKQVFTLTFGIVALIFAMSAATFASIMSLAGFSVVFTDKGLIPMASCLMSVYLNCVPAIACSILSRRLGMVCGLNKVSIALSVASAGAGTVIFMTLALAVIADNTGIFI